MHILLGVLACLACDGQLFGDSAYANERLPSDPFEGSLRLRSACDKEDLLRLLMRSLPTLNLAAAFSPSGLPISQRCRLGSSPMMADMSRDQLVRLYEMKQKLEEKKAREIAEFEEDAPELSEEEAAREAKLLEIAEQAAKKPKKFEPLEGRRPADRSIYINPNQIAISDARYVEQQKQRIEETSRKIDAEKMNKKKIEKAVEEARIESRRGRYSDSVNRLKSVVPLCSGSTALSGDVFGQICVDLMAQDKVEEAIKYMKELQYCAKSKRNSEIFRVVSLQIEANDIYQWDKENNPDEEAKMLATGFFEELALAADDGYVKRINLKKYQIKTMSEAVKALHNASRERTPENERIQEDVLCKCALDLLVTEPRMLRLPGAGSTTSSTSELAREKLEGKWLLAMTMKGKDKIKAESCDSYRTITWTSLSSNDTSSESDRSEVEGEFEMQKGNNLVGEVTRGKLKMSTYIRTDLYSYQFRKEEVDISIDETIEKHYLRTGGVPLPTFETERREKVVFLNSNLFVTLSDSIFYVWVRPLKEGEIEEMDPVIDLKLKKKEDPAKRPRIKLGGMQSSMMDRLTKR